MIITRVANKDNLSLWKLQGAKKWEVEVCKNEPGTNEEIVDLTWSPDGISWKMLLPEHVLTGHR